MKDFVHVLQGIGLSRKAARLYLAALDLGESTVQELARRAKLRRTTVYYILEELAAFGALVSTRRNRKTFYIAEKPEYVLKRVRERLHTFEGVVEELQKRTHSAYPRPRVYFLFGVPGFKQIWDKIFDSPEKMFRIITEGKGFLDFVPEKYILRDIIARKKKLCIQSKQLISDSRYARTVVVKDKYENRVSKILPPQYKFPFSEIICDDFVALISPRHENMLLVIESNSFAQTQRSLFEIIWGSAPEIS